MIANTGDDIEIHGGYVSPDPDLVTFWLADRIDERGWGLRDDTFTVMDGAARARRGRLVQPRRPRPRDLPRPRAAAGRGRDADRDRRRRCGGRSACAARVLPMSDDPVRTWVRARGALGRVPGVHDPRRARAGPVEDVEFRGAAAAAPTAEVLAALAGARAR